jgi:hypothetical protein
MNKIFLATLLVLIAYIDVIAQQNPHYTQYMYNMNVINPICRFKRKHFFALYRKQGEY